MKKYIVIPLVLAASLTTLSSNELSWVDEQVNAIKPPRKGVSNYNIAILSDPFIFLEKNRSKKEDEENTKTVRTKTTSSRSVASSASKRVYKRSSHRVSRSKKGFTLEAIMNMSALINGKWYKLNDKVKSYKLASITKTSIVLTRKSKKIVLSTHTKNKNLKFKSK